MMPGSFPILLVEDDENDVFFFERAMKKAGVTHPHHVVRDGLQAITFLGGTGEYAGSTAHPAPRLVILDLNLPGKHGLEVLRWMRARHETRTTLVIVLTSSIDVLDRHEAYTLGANSYLVKPADPNELAALLESIKVYWLRHNSVPPRHDEDPRLRAAKSGPTS